MPPATGLSTNTFEGDEVGRQLEGRSENRLLSSGLWWVIPSLVLMAGFAVAGAWLLLKRRS